MPATDVHIDCDFIEAVLYLCFMKTRGSLPHHWMQLTAPHHYRIGPCAILANCKLFEESVCVNSSWASLIFHICFSICLTSRVLLINIFLREGLVCTILWWYMNFTVTHYFHTFLFHVNTSTEKQEQLLISQAVKESNL